MAFTLINMKTWPRRQAFYHFTEQCPCSFSMTIAFDVTVLRKTTEAKNIKFFPAFLYGLTSLVNSRSEFRMALDEQGRLGIYDICHPCYTVLQPETGTFAVVQTKFESEFSLFYTSCLEDIAAAQTCGLSPSSAMTPNLFYVSALPWMHFSGFTLNVPAERMALQPIFTIGRYAEEAGRWRLPLAIQVHHAACDGWHVAQFVNALQSWCDEFSLK